MQNKTNFKEHLDSIEIFSTIAECAKNIGVEAYVIGGYVRDLILERGSKDIDVVCVGSGIALAQCVADSLGKGTSLNVFKSFGTAQVKLRDLEVEFVGARKESYRRESRKPIVEDGTLEDDQNRRDFTINALAISLNVATYGDLIDPFDGLKDMKAKILRTPLEPEVTFSDDPLRMMRAIRFATQLNFDIDADAFDAIKKQKDRIEIVSMERVTDEFNKIILAPSPSYGFRLLFHAGLLETFFPEFVALRGVEKRDGKTHKDNFNHTLQVLENVCKVSDDLWLRWAAILHDIAKPPTKRFHPKAGWTFHGHEDKGARMVKPIFLRLKLPLNEKMKFVQKLVKLHLRPIALVKKDITDSAIRRLIFDTGDDVEALMMLCRADITSKNDTKVKRYLSNFAYLEKRIGEIEEKDHIRNLQPVITGEIIMETFGIKPSREVGALKDKLKDAILEGEIQNEYDQAFSLMLKLGKKLGLEQKK
ncbi:HD domain-containing protein [Flammeovirgaceae bacterium SG7u.111]|nr:HD domain-containing protein [Flammeovirgaceae bacterium SG7u.132]WPO35766.1 HD domain-containing protein [Flammeovirgaceae bacterium SG7u.111]